MAERGRGRVPVRTHRQQHVGPGRAAGPRRPRRPARRPRRPRAARSVVVPCVAVPVAVPLAPRRSAVRFAVARAAPAPPHEAVSTHARRPAMAAPEALALNKPFPLEGFTRLTAPLRPLPLADKSAAAAFSPFSISSILSRDLSSRDHADAEAVRGARDARDDGLHGDRGDAVARGVARSPIDVLDATAVWSR